MTQQIRLDVRRVLVFALITAPLVAGCSKSRPQNLLWVGTRQVDIVEVTASDRFQELAGKFSQALEANAEWKAFAESVPDGKPLEYDPRCGLTEAEYREFVDQTGSLTTRKVGAGTLEITCPHDRVYYLAGDEALKHLAGIEIDLRKNVVRTPLGVAKDCRIVDADEKSVLGAWTGTEWRLEKQQADSADIVTAMFGLGRLKSSGRGVMYYRVKVGGRVATTPILQTVTFDLPNE